MEYEFRRGRSTSEARLSALYQQACSGRVRLACDWRTWHRVDRLPATDVAVIFGPPCTAGEGVACLAAAWASDLATDKEGQAGRWLARGCRLGVQRACAEHAWRLLNGRGMVANPPAAARALSHSCNAGAWLGCVGFGVALQRGAGVALDRARALTLFSRACSAGELDGCHRYAQRQAAGDGLPMNPAAATSLWRAACKGGHAQSCVELASSLRQGRGAAVDSKAATSAQHRACALGLRTACSAGLPQPVVQTRPRQARPGQPSVARPMHRRRGPPNAVPLPARPSSPLYGRPGWRPPQQRVGSYGHWLAAGYVAGPLLAVVSQGIGLLTPPIVHWAHGEVGRGLAATGAIFFLPAVTAGVTVAVVCQAGDCNESSAISAVLTAAVTTYVAWAVYDCMNNSSKIGYAQTNSLRLSPFASRDDEGTTTLGLAGSF